MVSRRMQRLNDLIRDELAYQLAREARDPRLQDSIISITAVETAPDLTVARVFVSVLGTLEEATATVELVKRARPFFRRQLAARLNLRHTPELEFRLDRSIAEGARINQMLQELGDE